ncbi:hypothetical protein RE432_14775 [Pusillimonas sp. SM2304]|uniref:hypothetical protein n=1 Tax=Pusillimonas sp. SM2304 TaxID=3073241 RepID=UPI0028751B61|nr:hypothetical protein [Pusillimonas sp. SM2304]MDS1141703.1 hypothetical protein [Pusillimonas sp. SM2304]
MFLSKGTASGSVTFNSPTYPVVFVRPTDGRDIRLRSNGGTSYTYFCTGSFSYWIFCSPPSSYSQNYGLQIFNASGQLVYTSLERPLRIMGMYSYTRPAKAKGGFWAGSGVPGWELPVLNTGAIGTVNLGGSNLAFAPNIDGTAAFVSFQGSGSSTLIETYPSVEGLRATSTGFQIFEYRVIPVQWGVSWDAAFDMPPFDPSIVWQKPPGTVVVADITGF